MRCCNHTPLLCLALLAVAPSASANTRLEDELAARPSLPFQLPPHPFHRTDGRRYVTRIRNGIIEAIWGVPPNRKPASRDGQLGKTRRKDASQPSPNILARYGEDVVLRFTIASEEEAEALAEAVNVLFLDVWEYTADWADIRLSKDVVPSLLGLLPASMQTSHTPLMHSLAQTIYESYPFPQQPSTPPPSTSPSFHPLAPPSDPPSTPNIFFQTYQPLSVITPWLSLLSSLFTTHVTLLSLGLSYEGRPIPALRVGAHPTNTQHPLGRRKTIVISGGAHAREWISTSTVNYVAYSLITAYGKSKAATQLVEDFDWVFIPTLNPDGYVYTWETDRLWRKNRQQTNLRFCKGLDLDRAFGFEWSGARAASNPCSESFSGEQPFEGVEALRFASWVRNETAHHDVDIVAFLDLHSYSQQVLYPYSFSCLATPPSLEDLEEVALGLAKAIRVKSGVSYGVTAACEGSVAAKAGGKGGVAGGHGGSTAAASAVRPASRAAWPKIESSGGSALDWMYHEMGVKHSYQIKLRDTGSYGFLLPAEEIVPTGKEVWSAVRWLGTYLSGNRGIERWEEMEGESGVVMSRPVRAGSDAHVDAAAMALQGDEADGELLLEL